MCESLVIIPTYNEKENIENLIRTILALNHSFNILVIDDNSADGTSTIVKNLAKENSMVNLIVREKKLGLGTAYITGFKWALLNSNCKYIFQMDADCSHDPGDLLRLHEMLLDKADLVIGSRFYKWRLSTVNWPVKRLILSLLAHLYVRLVLGNMNIYDTTSGFKGFRREVLEALNLDSVRSKGYAFQIEVNYRVFRKKFRIVEYPIIFRQRNLDYSKMSFRIILEALIRTVLLKIEALSKRNDF
jgi:dolichol-phosphate mannosyltransferase